MEQVHLHLIWVWRCTVVSRHLCSLADMTHAVGEKMSVHPYVRTSVRTVRTFVHNQNQCSHKPIYGIGRGRRVILKDITFKVIRGHSHGSVKFANSKSISSAICWDILDIVHDYDDMEKYLNVFGWMFHFQFRFRSMGLQNWPRMHFFHTSEECIFSKSRRPKISNGESWKGVEGIIRYRTWFPLTSKFWVTCARHVTQYLILRNKISFYAAISKSVFSACC